MEKDRNLRYQSAADMRQRNENGHKDNRKKAEHTAGRLAEGEAALRKADGVEWAVPKIALLSRPYLSFAVKAARGACRNAERI